VGDGCSSISSSSSLDGGQRAREGRGRERGRERRRIMSKPRDSERTLSTASLRKSLPASTTWSSSASSIPLGIRGVQLVMAAGPLESEGVSHRLVGEEEEAVNALVGRTMRRPTPVAECSGYSVPAPSMGAADRSFPRWRVSEGMSSLHRPVPHSKHTRTLLRPRPATPLYHPRIGCPVLVLQVQRGYAVEGVYRRCPPGGL